MAETSQTTSKPEHLEPSKLGTKEYWDALYDTEITNHETNPSDIGTVWFDDSDAEAKMVSFLNTGRAELNLDRNSTSFVDLGTGNGSMLHALRRAGWAGPCLGVDYSPVAVALAEKVAASTTYSEASDDEEESEDEDQPQEAKKREPSNNPISFAQWDVLNGPLNPDPTATPRRGAWDVVLDKGTFDAVCLSADIDAATGRRRSEDYRARVLELLRPGDGGIFLVTSCNWTEEELRAWFGEGGEGVARLAYAGQVEYRSFSFGGVKGQTISTVCFVKKDAAIP